MRLITSFFTGNRDAQLTALLELGAFSRDLSLDELKQRLSDKPLFDIRVSLGDPDSGSTPLAGNGEIAARTQTAVSEAGVADEEALRSGLTQLLQLGVRVPKDVIFFLKGFVYLMGAVNTILGELGPQAVSEEMSALFAHFWKAHGPRFVEMLDLDPGALSSQRFGIDVSVGERRSAPPEPRPGGSGGSGGPSL